MAKGVNIRAGKVNYCELTLQSGRQSRKTNSATIAWKDAMVGK